MDASRPNAIFSGKRATGTSLSFQALFSFPVYLLLSESKIQTQKPGLASKKPALTRSKTSKLMHQSIPAAPIPPPGQLRGICTHCQSRGSGISLPKGYPRAFDTHVVQTKTILSEKTSSLSLIGLSVKDWTKLWRFLKVCFLDFRHFLTVYQATTLKRGRERSL